MITLEQVRLLESKVVKTIELVKALSGENASLRAHLESEKKRVLFLEEQNQRFKSEVGRIEEGILSTLDRLNKFEDAVERSLRAAKSASGEAPRPAVTEDSSKAEEAAPEPAAPEPAAPEEPPPKEPPPSEPPPLEAPLAEEAQIPADEAAEESLEDEDEDEEGAVDDDSEDELDIF